MLSDKEICAELREMSDGSVRRVHDFAVALLQYRASLAQIEHILRQSSAMGPLSKDPEFNWMDA